MGSEWISTTLGQISTDVSYGYTESASIERVGPHFLRITDIQNGVVDWSRVPYCPIDKSKLKKYLLKKGDIVVARTGNSTGENYIFTGPDETVFASYLIRFQIDKGKADPFYVWYNMRSPAWWKFVGSSKTGSAQAGANAKLLGLFPLNLPPLSQQKSIAHILGTLDDKIELNRQINTTLEAMAQALFKSWFVDFDPVIDNALAAGNPIPPELAARAERRQQHHARANTSADAQTTPYQPLPAAIQQQFPNHFVFTEAMGWVPEGWSIKKAEDIATVSIGKTPPRKEQEWFSEERDGNVVWVSIRDMGSANAFIGDSAEYLTPESISKFNVKKVPKDSVLLSFKLTLGRVSIAQCEMTTNEAIAHFVNPEFGISREFLYCYLITFDYGRLGSTSSIATAVNSKLIKALPVLVPSHKVLDEFSSIVAAWFDQISQINMETNTLVALRDSLLPKLLSGQLRIPDAEAAVDKVLAEA